MSKRDCFKGVKNTALKAAFDKATADETLTDQQIIEIGTKLIVEQYNNIDKELVKLRRQTGEKGVKAAPVKYEAPKVETKPKTKTDGKEKRPVLEKLPTSGNQEKGREDSAKLRTEKEEVKPTKTERKQQAFESIDSVAEALKKKFGIELPEGTQKMGISQNDLIDLAAKAAKALASTGIEINEAIKKIIAEYKAMGLMDGLDEVNLALSVQSELSKDVFKTPPQKSFDNLTEEQSELEKESEKRLIGIRNKLLTGSREKAAGIKDKLTVSAVGLWDWAQTAINSGAINPMRLVQDMITNPRLLDAYENAALTYYKVKVLKQIDILSEKINDSKSTQEEVSQAKLLLTEKVNELSDLNTATDISGKLAGQALWSRSILADAEFNLVTQVNIAKSYTGLDNLPAEVMERFKSYEQQIKDYEARELEWIKKLENERGKLTIATAQKTRTAKDKAKSTADKIRKLKFTSKFEQLNKLQSNPLMALPIVAWDGAIAGIAITYESTGSLITAVDQAIEKLKNTEWYKNLKKKTEADKILNSIYGDVGLNLPTYKDGKLVVSDSFLKDIIRAGYDTIDTATAKTMEIIGDPDLDEVTVRDAISRYGKQQELSKDEIDKKLREIRRFGKLKSALEAVQAKKRPMRSGVKRDALTAEERDLKRQINELLKDIPLSSKELETQWKTAYDATVSRVKNRIEDVKRQIEAGKKDEKRRDTPTSPELELLREELKDLNKILNAIDSKENNKMSFEKRSRLIENALIGLIEEYDRKIKNKDFTVKEKPEPIKTPKILKLRQELEQKRKQLADLEREFAPELGEARKNKAKMDSIDRQIIKVQKQLDGEIEIETKKQVKKELPQAIQEAQDRLNNLRDILKDTDKYREMVEKRKLAAAKDAVNKSIENYENRLKNKEFVTQKREQVVDAELKKLRARQRAVKQKFELEKHKWILSQRSEVDKYIDNVFEIFALPRTLMASVDLSAPLRQGLILTAANPRLAAKAFREMLSQMMSAQKYEDWLYQLQETEEYQFAKSAGLYIAMPNVALLAQEEQFVSRIAGRLPLGWGKLVEGSNRAYSAYLNVLRWGVWTEVSSSMEQNGLDKTKDKINFKGLARFINSTTGRGQLWTDNAIGTSSSSSERALNAMFFAPRYVVSRFNLINPVYYWRLPKAIRKEVLRTMMSFLGAYGILAALAAAAGAEIEGDIRSSDFGKFRFGNLRFDLMAGIQQPLRLIYGTMTTWQKKSLATGEIKDLNIDKFKEDTVEDEIFRFMKTKMSPVAGTFFEMMRAPKGKTVEVKLPFMPSYEEKVYFRNIMGEDIGLTNKLLGLVTPLYLSDMREIYLEEGLGFAAAAGVPALFGAGAQYFDANKVESDGETSIDDDIEIDFDDIIYEDDFEMDEFEITYD